MPSQSELSGGQVLQKIYIRGENGTLLSIPETYVIVENNNEVVGQDPCQFGGDGDQNTLENDEPTVVHIIEESEYKPTDEDLTSLNWLQDINVVNGIPLQAKGVPSIRNSVAEHHRIASTPSDRGEQASEPCSETESSCDGSNLSYTEINLPVDVNYGHQSEGVGQKVVFTKPPHSFSTLIFLAIESSSIKAMPVRDIYAWITQHFPYYRYAPAGWKNSVRHNLSLSKSFCKVQQYPGVGKGSLWKVDPHHRPQLIQSLRKIPDFSAEQLQQIIAGGTESSPAKTSAADRQTNFDEGEPQDPLSSTPSSSSPCSPYTHRSNVPDPTLFPYLSRRLGVSMTNDPAPAVCSQPRADVDAATAMLALRQEFVLSTNFPPKKCYSPRRTREHSYEQQSVDNDSFIHEVQEEVEVRSTAQPSPVEEDHTYSFCPRPSRQRPVHKIAGRKSETLIKSEPVSPESDHFTAGTSIVIKSEPIFYEEDSDTLESANALLGLAGIKREYAAVSEPEPQPEKSRAKNHSSGSKKAKSAPKRGRGRVRGK